MSGGTYCTCAERKKPIAERDWEVVQYKSNHSAFNGYRYTASRYSQLRCRVCGHHWRTRAAYVERVAN